MIQAWPDGVAVREHEPLARHSPWRVGGPCDAFVVVHRREALTDTLARARDLGWSRTVLGAGTRTVFRDPGVAGMVLRLGGAFCGVSAEQGGWVAGAGASLAVLAAAVPGWEPLRASAGTVGGSLLLDPGWDPWVDAVWIHSRGAEREVGVDELRTRHTNALITAVRVVAPSTAALPPGCVQAAKGPAGRPVTLDSALAGFFAAEKGMDLRAVLRKAGLGGVRLRDVWIPDACPELLVNLGGATAKDLALLQRSAMDRVLSVSGIEITDRMRWVGRQG